MFYKTVANKIKRIFSMNKPFARSTELLVHSEMARIRSDLRYENPKSLMRYGGKIYSQNDEDGIIAEIFSRIGTRNKIFVEFGVGNGLENNTYALLLSGWKGLWIEGSPKSVKVINENLKGVIASGNLTLTEAFITRDNINELISNSVDENEIDFLSVDIDGNDYEVLNAISCINPRVMALEYNAKFAPPVSFCMDYNDTHTWKGDDYFGVSLKFLEEHIDGYCLVGCNITGANAFFVRKDLVADKFLEPFTAENHFEPARYYLSGFASGHSASYKTVEQTVKTRSS